MGEKRKRVLLVDDSQLVLMTERLMLAGLDWEIATASNGTEALAATVRLRPDLILLDIGLTGRLDAAETCRQIRLTTGGQDVSIVLVTTNRDHLHRVLAAGADDFVTMPLDRGELLRKVSPLLGDSDTEHRVQRVARATG